MRFLENTNINFVRWKWHAIALSLLVIGAGIVTVIQRGGLPLGVDFAGGSAIQLKFEKPTPEETVRNVLSPLFAEASVQRYGKAGENRLLVRLPMPPGAEVGTGLSEGAQRVEDALRAANVGNFEVVEKNTVGPAIGEDLKRKGQLATAFALGGILVYIGIRFRFSFAVGAIAATLHDILVTLAFLTWFGYDLSLNIIAAILTMTGYSVNDTIVIFDRVRENQKTARRESLDTLVNRSVNQTLSRTIITAGVTFLAVLAMYLFGGEVLEGMAFTLLVGILTGTYSTVFIASAIAILLSGRKPAAGVSQAQATAARRAKA
jgi:preprotein translocase subunit SecF